MKHESYYFSIIVHIFVKKYFQIHADVSVGISY